MLSTSLRRITRDGHWIPELDGLRFLSIGFVFLFHLYVAFCAVTHVTGSTSWLFQPIRNGARGVPVFFAISGLVLALPFARHHLNSGESVSLRKYYLRRLTRLEPPYILCVLGCMLLYAIYHHSFAGLLPHLAASLFYAHNFVYGAPNPANGVLWSLEIEVQFYLLAPLLMQVFRLRPAWLRRTLVVAFTLLWILLQPHYLATPRLQMTLLAYLPCFLAGMLAADLLLSRPKSAPSLLWDALGLLALALLYCGTWSDASFTPILPACAFILCVAAMRGNMLRRTLASKWIALIGGMCYSIYLWHLKLIIAVLALTRHCIVPSLGFTANFALQLLLAGVPTLAVCVLFYIAVERPCMNPRWPVDLLRKWKRRPVEDASLDSSGVS